MTTLLEIGLSNALVVAILAPAALGLGRLSRRPAWAHAVWVVVLLKLVTPPMALVPIRLAASPEAPPAPIDAPAPAEAVVAVGEAPAPSPEIMPDPAPPRWERPSWPVALGAAWIGGSLAWVALATVRIARFARAMKRADEAPEGISAWVAELSAQVGRKRPPRVVLAPGRVAPMVWSLGGRGTLVVPEALWSRLDEAQRAALLVHELAHLRRGDQWVRLLELLATGLYWWHPALWLARSKLHRAEEQCCDLWVVWLMPGSKKPYASALVEALDFLSEGRPARMPAGASGMGQVKDLSRRIVMIMRGDAPRGLSRAGRLAAVGLAALLLPWRPGLAAQDPAPPRDEPAAAPAERERSGDAKPAPVELPREARELADRAGSMADSLLESADAARAPGFEVQREEVRRARDRLRWSTEMARKGYVASSQVGDDAEVLLRALRRLEAARGDREQERREAEDAVASASVRLKVKTAELTKAEAQRRIAAASLARMTRLAANNAVSSGEVDKAQSEVEIADANVQEAKALVEETALGVGQAQRRLEALKGSEGRQRGKDVRSDRLALARTKDTADSQRRLDELESKLDRVLKELESLRKERGPGESKPEAARPPAPSPRSPWAFPDSQSAEEVARTLYKIFKDREPNLRELDEAEMALGQGNRGVRLATFLVDRMAPRYQKGHEDDYIAALADISARGATPEQVADLAYRSILGSPRGPRQWRAMIEILRSNPDRRAAVKAMVEEAIRLRGDAEGTTPAEKAR